MLPLRVKARYAQICRRCYFVIDHVTEASERVPHRFFTFLFFHSDVVFLPICVIYVFISG